MPRPEVVNLTGDTDIESESKSDEEPTMRRLPRRRRRQLQSSDDDELAAGSRAKRSDGDG